VSLVIFASNALQIRIKSTKLVVVPGAGRTGKPARVAYHQFNTCHSGFGVGTIWLVIFENYWSVSCNLVNLLRWNMPQTQAQEE
jgi:hypothetical protein